MAATVAILAGPGSGKTHTLTSRVVWLVDNTGYAPQDVVVATFTVKAAREMKERIGRALGGGREKKIVLGTFHSIARRYLAAYGRRIGLDGSGRDPPESRDLETCYREYQSHLERSNLLDYDDLLTRCVELLQKHPSCVANVQAVLIDEYQDTNGIQYELMRLFAQARERITIVGDPDQSIYGWRSAEIKNLYRLLRDYPDAEEVSLEENYRSSQAIQMHNGRAFIPFSFFALSRLGFETANGPVSPSQTGAGVDRRCLNFSGSLLHWYGYTTPSMTPHPSPPNAD
ncbi:ATP-dependent DNA helicase srs2 [Colletotrichum plurivorum]|uniref:ATP-dependent DNA helicase srs2 n=1 Tax=Colletotrichum plurivorum TaxID=2175906 RepID=A0A8H6NR69_9PEZI|nr:ATP-dependent DNA helicase srs2 [Colletotrichum plurivorum]